MSALRVTRVERWEDAPESWDELVASSVSDTVFLTRAWVTSWWAAYRGKRELELLLCHDGDTLVGIAPFYRTRMSTGTPLTLGVLRIVGDGSHDADHLDLIARRGSEHEVVRATVDWLVAHHGGWDLLELGSVRAASPLVIALAQELTSRNWRLRDRTEEHAIIALPETWELYLKSLSSAMRSSLRRKEKSLRAQHQASFRSCTREADLPEYLELLFTMHADRWENRGQAGSFSEPARRRLYEEVARRALERGWLSLVMLDVDGEPAAVEFGLRYGDTHSFLQSGFASKFASLSVGVVLKSHILKTLIGEGVRHYDFLHGEDAYKLKWGPTLAEHRNFRCASPRSAGAAFLHARDLVARGKAWINASMPESITVPLRRGFRMLRPYRDGLEERR